MQSRQLYCALLCIAVLAPRLTCAQSYRQINVDNPGTIVGTVKWTGPVPALATVVVNKDVDVCDPQHAKKRDLERLIIGPNKGVANTVVFLKNIDAGKPMDLPVARRSLNQKTCRYEPHILLVPQGGKLSIRSSDPVLHTVHMSGAAQYNLPFPFPDQWVDREMSEPGVVNLQCNAGHVWMNGIVIVAPHPYYAITDESGAFRLDGVPPGNYVLVAWHEGWGAQVQAGFYDVLSETRIARPVYSAPHTLEKSVTVPAAGSASVEFLLSDSKARLSAANH
ncbi:MAG: hypothetical protein JO187_06945 [Acidobacteria bacterium]|nr:hypothetical protein [Acidobacteriota bacterium]